MSENKDKRKVVIELDNVKRYFHVGSEIVKALRGVSFKIYENDRHELLNETDKLQVMNDIYDFLKKNM